MCIALFHTITRCHCLIWQASGWQKNDFIKQPQDREMCFCWQQFRFTPVDLVSIHPGMNGINSVEWLPCLLSASCACSQAGEHYPSAVFTPCNAMLPAKCIHLSFLYCSYIPEMLPTKVHPLVLLVTVLDKAKA